MTTMRAVQCPSCGAPVGATVNAGYACRYCGAALVAGPAGPAAVQIERIGANVLEVIKCIRGFSGLGLAEVRSALASLPAAFSIREPASVPDDLMKALVGLGCVCHLVPEPARLPSEPAFVGHDGAWGFTIEAAGHAPLEAIKLVREFCDLGLAEAKAAIETPRRLIPIVTAASHEEIRRRFAAIGYTVSFSPSGG